MSTNEILVYCRLKTDKFTDSAIAAVMGVVGGESGFRFLLEFSYLGPPATSNASLKNIFAAFSGKDDNFINRAKRSDESFFNTVYGGVGGNSPTEGNKYRGRGFNQITFKSVYQAAQTGVNQLYTDKVDFVNKPQQLEKPEYAARALSYYFRNLKNINDFETAFQEAYRQNAGPGRTFAFYASSQNLVHKGGIPRKRDKGKYYLEQILKGAFDNKCGDKSTNIRSTGQTGPITGQTEPAPGTTGSTVSGATGGTVSGVVGQEKSRGDIPGQEQTKDQKELFSTKFIKQISQPKLKPKEIRFKMEDEDARREIVRNLGNFPIVYYNGVQIDFKDIEFLQLYTAGNLPTLKLVFKDTLSLMKDRGFPLDDTIITIYISPRSEQLKPIHLDLKIIKFSAAGRTYTITASLDANLLYIKKYKSYSKKTSFQTLQEIAGEIGLGFNSNIDDTNDSMVWINPGQKCMDFIDTVVNNSYKSDETYLSAYIDFYYSLNYVDVQKELGRNIKEELGITDSGLNEIYKKNPDLVSKLILTNEIAFRAANVYFKDYQVINRASTISLTEGYATKMKYYDEIKKSFLIFDVESITQDAENKIQLKGKTEDETFYNENIEVIYVGKLDSDNMFENYHYASIQNYRNLVDMEKIGIEVVMKTPNFNFYRYQKVLVFVTGAAPTPANSLYNNRLSGEWLIVDIIFRQDGSVFEQVIKLIKKELELTAEEAQVDPKPRKKKRTEGSRGTFSNPSSSGTPETTSTSTATGTAEVTSEDKVLPPNTAETANMQFSVPPPPQNPSKTSPSGFPVKATSFLKKERSPTQFVIHYTAGWQVLDKGAGTVDFLMNGRTDYPGGLSYHYIISVDGHIENVVDPKYMASHSGDPINKFSIGISLSSLGTTFASYGIPGANAQLDSLRKSSNTYKKSLYGKNEDYVKLVNQDFQPIKYRGFESCQEVSAAQIAALGTLMKSLKAKFPTLPSYNGLTPEYFEILFPVGTNGDFGSPSYKTNQSLIYTHCSVTRGKVDIAPTPRLVEFFRNLRL